MTAKLLDETQVADILGIARQTLVNWRYQGRGPAYVKWGAKNASVRYRPEDVDAWIDAQRVEAEAAS